MNTTTIPLIPLQTEIIVQIAHRFRDASPAVSATIRKYPVRTPEELERAIDEVHAEIWRGLLAVMRGVARTT